MKLYPSTEHESQDKRKLSSTGVLSVDTKECFCHTPEGSSRVRDTSSHNRNRQISLEIKQTTENGGNKSVIKLEFTTYNEGFAQKSIEIHTNDLGKPTPKNAKLHKCSRRKLHLT